MEFHGEHNRILSEPSFVEITLQVCEDNHEKIDCDITKKIT